MEIDCLFCKIIEGTIPADKVYEDDLVLAFNDIDPKAPVHVLIIPKIHVASILQIDTLHSEYLAAMNHAAKKVAQIKGIADTGFRLIMNTGQDGGQTVGHLHMHLMGGRQLNWPPG